MNNFERENEQISLLAKNRPALKEYDNYYDKKVLLTKKILTNILRIVYTFIYIISIVSSIYLIKKGKIFLGVITIIIHTFFIIFISALIFELYKSDSLGFALLNKLYNEYLNLFLTIFSFYFLIYIFIYSFQQKKSLTVIYILQFITLIFERVGIFNGIINLLDKIKDCIYGKKLDELYNKKENEKMKIKNDFINLTKKYFDIEKIVIENKEDNSEITSILYIDIIDCLFCICDREIICFKYPTFHRIYHYEDYFKSYIDYIYYQKSRKYLIASNREAIYISKLSNNDEIMLISKINLSIKMMLEIPNNKYIILQSNGLCSCINKAYKIIEDFYEKAKFIQISPNKKLFTIIIDDYLIIKDTRTFNNYYMKYNNKYYSSNVYFLDNDYFIYSINNEYLELFNIKDCSIILKFECNFYIKDILKLENSNYFILCNTSCDNTYKHPIICEFRNNEIKEIGKIYYDSIELYSCCCFKNNIFLGNNYTITLFRIKKELFDDKIDILSN